ncbi:unnamed protein product [Didymodactylos carnosus]|uniref:Uncharacterized protein n=1 Tax=Didymodactylos carnosus TaxID=1234261 RepID=A0A814B8A2_9BILA|nr:unnamed protein product [Didymodactylos carnosus]CAF3702986.1 unnamed protein product [Didymodactylos carnosus]
MSQIRCITSLMEMEANQTVSNIQTIMPQVKQSSDRHAVLCLQEMNGKTRHCAYLLVIQCGKLWIKISENNFIESLTEFFHITMSGLTSNSTSMISSTLLALGRLCLEFKENLAGTIVDELMSTLILVLQSRQREIVQAALSFCRVTLIIFSEVILSQYIKELVC